MKTLLLLFTTILLLTSCKSERQEELESEVAALQDITQTMRSKIDELESTISDCNSNINSAKIYAGDSYDNMVYALDSLEECGQ